MSGLVRPYILHTYLEHLQSAHLMHHKRLSHVPCHLTEQLLAVRRSNLMRGGGGGVEGGVYKRG